MNADNNHKCFLIIWSSY